MDPTKCGEEADRKNAIGASREDGCFPGGGISGRTGQRSPRGNTPYFQSSQDFSLGQPGAADKKDEADKGSGGKKKESLMEGGGAQHEKKAGGVVFQAPPRP